MNKLSVVPSPHLKSANSTTRIMLDVVIALLPALAAGCYYFGFRALLVALVCVASSVLAEYICRKILKRDNTISDLSAVVTGLLLAFNLPVTIPLWIAAVGSVFAIVVVKQLFGGIGQNFANPAITARIVLMVSFSQQMTNWVSPFFYQNSGVDAVATATPLGLLKEGSPTLPSLLDLFVGDRAGCLGETSVLAILIGFAYLLIRRVVTPVVPAAFVGTVFLFTLCAGENPLYHCLSGGLMLGACFMATDYATSPVTTKGKLIFGVGCGLITSIIRLFGSYPEGVSYSILLMNLLVPYIDRYTRIKPFGAATGGKR